ncbi:molybdenum cofactor guanylyltransferase [Halanaeroarchaeum sulfurireducens]|uniref:Probable molybdenum cofactor guanylyltransferase n=1 Tax=Halanaeroarchaeum sulfurireducens TaxID=1604004 RepID=A0A0F7PEG8_9EURY|nr:molybdenum cofactor guanylyltransferase [Halanaeroarchaeum sulfurireducens]AKH97693.1 molybdopterin-guanine dinucleotide biosynthesis protein A [Halanaeroarchaeum sulfurireducens]ALG82088.1 molybdopterin-guanine dinucleotide biosynthesis protein A [Halanaeroarchaeum sulfurireducens]
MKGAVVLAGGFSTRFGDADKAVADVAGEPMIRRVVSTVAPLVDDIVVNVRTDQRRSIETALADLDVQYGFAFDDVPDRGPLAGMVVGLERSAAEYTLVVACDMPFVDRKFVETLFERANGTEAAIPVERGEDGEWLQPLQAVYETDRTLRVTSEALEDGIESPATAVGRLSFDAVPVSGDGERWSLRNVNTPADRREAERYVERSQEETAESAFSDSPNGVR